MPALSIGQEMDQTKTPPKQLKKAVALRYRPGVDQAPQLTARGQGLVAEKIIDLARRHGIPIQEDPALVQMLAQIDLHQEIPPEAYLVVAEILAFIYTAHKRWARPETAVSEEKNAYL